MKAGEYFTSARTLKLKIVDKTVLQISTFGFIKIQLTWILAPQNKNLLSFHRLS